VDARYLPILIRLPDDLDVDDAKALTAYTLHLLAILDSGGVEAALDGRYSEEGAPAGATLN
jgi:hypothetical protein